MSIWIVAAGVVLAAGMLAVAAFVFTASITWVRTSRMSRNPFYRGMKTTWKWWL